jgi:tetratricopeptide (TPR) repeat protein
VAGDQNKFQTAMTHARRFVEESNWTEAAKAYRYALAEFPNDQAAIIGFGQATLSAGQVEIAQKAFQQALKLDPSNHQALIHMADVQQHLGQMDAAAENYLRVGNILSARGNLEAAIEAWEQAIDLLPDHVDAHRNVAQTLARLNEPRQAARHYLTLAAIYQNRDDNDRAMQQIDSARGLIGDDPGVALAIEALQQGNPIDPDEISDKAPAEYDDVTASLDLVDFEDSYQGDAFGEEDPFALDVTDLGDMPKGGLVQSFQQNALAELANVIFEDESDSGNFAATMPKEEINMLIVQAIDLQSRDRVKDAINNYRQVIKAGAGRPALYFNLGLLFKGQGQFDEAAKMLQMSARDKKYNVASHLALGETYHAADNLESAVRHFIEGIKLIDLRAASDERASYLHQHYETLADEYLAEGDPNMIANFIVTLEKFFSRSNWEQKIHQARQRVDSIAEDGNIMSLAEFMRTPETEVVVTTLALTNEFLRRNLLMTASEECLRAIQKAPSYLRLHTRLAEILLKQNHTDQAITKYLFVAKVYRMRNQPDQGINIYQKILKLAPMDVTVRSELIDLYIDRNDIEQALEQYLTLADSYFQLAQVDRAIEKYNEALRLADSEPGYETWKSNILSKMGDIYNQRFDWVKATTAFEDLLKINPNNQRTQQQLVDLYFKQSKTERAIGSLDNLLAGYKKQDQSAKSLDLLKEFVSTYPENMDLRQRLAVVFGENGFKQEAIAEYDALGEMQLEHGLRDQATKTIQAILDLGPDDAEGYRRLLSKISGGMI